MQKLALPVSVIRPGPFMELMTQKDFVPALGIWGVAPRMVGWDTHKPWVAVRDIGKAVANAFADPESWVERDNNLIGDVRSLARCREGYRQLLGGSGSPPGWRRSVRRRSGRGWKPPTSSSPTSKTCLPG